jgi:hypothetical protein
MKEKSKEKSKRKKKNLFQGKKQNAFHPEKSKENSKN